MAHLQCAPLYEKYSDRRRKRDPQFSEISHVKRQKARILSRTSALRTDEFYHLSQDKENKVNKILNL